MESKARSADCAELVRSLPGQAHSGDGTGAGLIEFTQWWYPRVLHTHGCEFRDLQAPGPPWRRHPASSPAAGTSSAVWLRPGYVAVVEYREYSSGGRFRPFKGLRNNAEADLDWLPLPPLPPGPVLAS